MGYIYAVVTGLVLVFIGLLFQKKPRSQADLLLIGLNLTLIAFLLSDILIHWRINSYTLLFQNSLPLLIFPLYIFYTLHFILPNQKIPLQWWLLFTPLVAILIYGIIDHFILHTYTSEEVLVQFNTPSWPYQVIFKGSQLLYIGVLIYIIRVLRSFDFKLKDHFSSTEKINLSWLTNFSRIYLFTVTTSFILFVSQNLGWISFSVSEVYGIIYGILIIGLIYMTYQGLRHFTLTDVNKEEPMQTWNDSFSQAQALPEKKALNEEDQLFEKQLLAFVENEKIYLNPKLSLNELAQQMNTNPHYVSRIINSKEGRSFYDLINGFRVHHFQNLLAHSEKNYTILALGLESGFNSKASLNRIFKNVTGLTPKEYSLKIQEENHPTNRSQSIN